MTNLATRARQNRETALLALARRRSGNVLNVAFGRERNAPLPVLSFAARRKECPELATLPVAANAPAARPALVLVSNMALPHAA
ncbi:hypothetical protein [Vannielia litorea]|uniref:Uncharacterized protein n=1 Tax=Vannielia litorea TaxID=1217970 RepID=A0A1N6F6Q0_9RHOB|nr:hypothetical protein [Vannielia litorea]SIN90962.1 hypothetical protein SAMN05444002_1423 [Vannielia litorea]